MRVFQNSRITRNDYPVSFYTKSFNPLGIKYIWTKSVPNMRH